MIGRAITISAFSVWLALAGATATVAAEQEGIKVHGDWTITLRNPDGTVAQVYEFKNALWTGIGDSLLARLVGGSAVAGQFTVFLSTTPAQCNTNNSPCQIVEANSPFGANSRDLVKSVPTTGPDAGKLVLSGTVRVPVSGGISRVETGLSSCGATTTPADCAPADFKGFTQKILSSNLPVVENQLVEVKVVISFS